MIQIIGVRAGNRKMKTRARRLGNMRGMNRRIITDWFGVVQVNFNTSGGGHKPPKRWKPLKPATLAQKRKQGFSSKPLIRTGTLRQQWLLQPTSTGGKLISLARAKKGFPYARAHEDGIRKRNLPQRKILPTTRHASAIAVKHLGRHVKFSIKVL